MQEALRPDARGDADPGIIYRGGGPGDLVEVGRVYLRAFTDTLSDLRSPNLSAQAVADVMAACLADEPDCMTVAETGGTDAPMIVGYVLAPSDVGRVWHASWRYGLVARWLWRWATGRYRLSVRGALALLSDKLRFRGARGLPAAACEARILSIAVDPAFQRRRIGRRLLELALTHLRAQGVPCVRLEVRPDRAAARRLYESAGFQRVGEFSDSRGEWGVMILELRGPEAGKT